MNGDLGDPDEMFDYDVGDDAFRAAMLLFRDWYDRQIVEDVYRLLTSERQPEPQP